MKLVHLFKQMALIPAVAVSLLSCSPTENGVYMIHPHEEALETAIEGRKMTSLFLAGTIDMGNSADWQSDFHQKFQRLEGSYLLYNPRQAAWDASRPGEMDYQVNWELEHLEKADHIIMYIIGSSKSPVSLLEMGLHARSGKMYVICEKDFYRYDNVRITCAHYGIPLYDTAEDFWESVAATGELRR